MSIQTELVTLLSSLVAGRVYPSGTASTVTPYLTYARVVAIEQVTLDSNGGVDNIVNTRMQIDAWASSYGAAQTLSESVRSALKGWANSNIVLSEEDGYEPETKLHRVMLDTSVFHG